MITIHREPDFDTAAKHSAEAIVEALARWNNDPILLLFSGGSPLEILKFLPHDMFTNLVTVGVSDERYSTDPTINNFCQIMHLPAKHWIDTRPQQDESLEQLGIRFDTALKTWRQNYPTGKIIITQGIGLDGHTAGMMPVRHRYAQALAGGPGLDEVTQFNKLFNDPNVWAIGYDAKEKNKYPLRVTTTVPFLLSVDLSVVFVCGEDKKKPLEDVFASNTDISAIPGRIIHQMKHCLLYTDLGVDTVITQ